MSKKAVTMSRNLRKPQTELEEWTSDIAQLKEEKEATENKASAFQSDLIVIKIEAKVQIT